MQGFEYMRIEKNTHKRFFVLINTVTQKNLDPAVILMIKTHNQNENEHLTK